MYRTYSESRLHAGCIQEERQKKKIVLQATNVSMRCCPHYNWRCCFFLFNPQIECMRVSTLFGHLTDNVILSIKCGRIIIHLLCGTMYILNVSFLRVCSENQKSKCIIWSEVNVYPKSYLTLILLVDLHD